MSLGPKGMLAPVADENMHIWVGIFGPGAPETYFEETYDDDDDDALLSTFAQDQNETWYDHDVVEISWLDEAEHPFVRDLVSGHSYSEQYLEKVVEAAAGLGFEKANVFVLAREDQFDVPRSVSRSDLELKYLGRYWVTV